MRRRPLGRSAVTLSELTLGTWTLSGASRGRPPWPERFSDLVASALAYGVTSFDVSPLWGDGEAERALGRALADRKPPEAQVITRAGARREGDQVVRSWTAAALMGSCEESLERLGVDTIDLLLVYGLPDPDGEDAGETDGVEEAAALLTRDGKARAWGVCAETEDDVHRALGLGAEAVCLPYNLLYPDVFDAVASDLAAQDVGVLVRSPLAYGMLGGTWDAGTFFPEGDHRRDRWPTPAARAARLAQVDRLRFLVDDHDDVETLAEAATRWVLRRPEVTSALVSPGSANQLRELARASLPEGDPHLPDDALARIAEVQGVAPSPRLNGGGGGRRPG